MNAFTADTVVKRWDSNRLLLAKVGVEIVGYPSDEDSRFLKAMHLKTNPPCEDIQTPASF
jgi:hypothetical protein